jgi:hypothetical protein
MQFTVGWKRHLGSDVTMATRAVVYCRAKRPKDSDLLRESRQSSSSQNFLLLLIAGNYNVRDLDFLQLYNARTKFHQNRWAYSEIEIGSTRRWPHKAVSFLALTRAAHQIWNRILDRCYVLLNFFVSWAGSKNEQSTSHWLRYRVYQRN